MSDLPSLDPPRPIPKEAAKFLKLSPSVKVMTLKKSSTTCRVKASQGLIGNSALAGGSGLLHPSQSSNISLGMKPIKKDSRKLSIFPLKPSKEQVNRTRSEQEQARDARRQVLVKRSTGTGDEMKSKSDSKETIDRGSASAEEPKRWYTRWMDAVISTRK